MSCNKPHNALQRAAHADTRRRGSTYVMVLGLSLVLTVIGLSALTVSRITSRMVGANRDSSETRFLAFTAAEHALNRINADNNWRTTFNGATVAKSFGRGTFSWRVVDENDGDLTDDNSDPATIVATGTVGDASHTLSLRVTCDGGALNSLSACLSAGGEVEVTVGNALTLTGSNLTSNDVITNNGTIYGNVEAQSLVGAGTVVGDITTGAEPKTMPDSTIFNTYKSLATTISPGATIDQKVLSSASNPWGEANSDGIYYVHLVQGDLRITNSRICGTLVVRCNPGTKVIIGGPAAAALLHNYQANHPVLIVNGDVELELASDTVNLTESGAGVNFNPPGTPYSGQMDTDQADSYPNEIQGLVHVTGDLTIKSTTRVRGVVICEGKATVEGTNEIIYDSSVSQNPPSGYTTGTGEVRPGLWQRVVE